jgi:hypothetical protein
MIYSFFLRCGLQPITCIVVSSELNGCDDLGAQIPVHCANDEVNLGSLLANVFLIC